MPLMLFGQLHVFLRVHSWAIFLLLASCAKERIPHYPPMPATEAIRRMAERSRTIHSISSQGLITLTRPNGDTVRLDAALVLQLPDRARLRAWKFGRAVFDMTLTPDGLWLLALAEGDHRQEILAAGANTGKLTREWLGLIAGAMKGSIVEEAGGTLLLRQSRDDGTTMFCRIDAKTLTPRQYDLKDDKGENRFTLKLSRYAEIGAIIWPYEIEAMSATGQILIELHDVEINGDITPAAFRPPKRAEKIESPTSEGSR